MYNLMFKICFIVEHLDNFHLNVAVTLKVKFKSVWFPRKLK